MNLNAVQDLIKQKVSDLERNNREWNACRVAFAACLQDWQRASERVEQSESPFPIRDEGNLEQYEAREAIICKGNATVRALKKVLEEADHMVSELLNCLGIRHIRT